MIDVGLVFNFDPIGLIDFDAKLLAPLDEALIDIVGCLVIAAPVRVLVDHDPLIFAKVDSFLDGQSSQSVLINMDDLILFEDLWRS